MVAAAWYYLTSCVVFIAVGVGVYIIPSDRCWRGYVGSFAYLDGVSHISISDRGYLKDTPPSVARFPAYPLLGRMLTRLTGLTTEAALVILANASFLGAFIVLAWYIEVRGQAKAPARIDLTLLALGLWPSTLFFRMAYTESLFLFCALLAMYAMERRARYHRRVKALA
jgi:Gpi18-like mannosyltransferase